MADYKNTVDFIKSVYGNQEFTPLAVPVFVGNEKKYLNECIDTTFVSSVGKFVDRHMDQTDRSHASFAFRRHHQPRPAKARPMRTMAMAGAAAIATMHDSAAHSRMAAVTRQRPARRE